MFGIKLIHFVLVRKFDSKYGFFSTNLEDGDKSNKDEGDPSDDKGASGLTEEDKKKKSEFKKQILILHKLYK